MAAGAGIDMETRDVVQGIRWQVEHGIRNNAPVTARVCEGLLAIMHSDTATGRRIAGWTGKVLEDAMPLRLAGGFHSLHLTGAEHRLAAIYRGEITEQAEIDAILVAVTRDHDAVLLPWLDGPPQTNEAGRSSSIMAALLWLSGRIGSRFELLEIGASAGANTMMDRYGYDLGGVLAGPTDSPVLIRPDWRGSPPPVGEVRIAAIRGCDRAPIDLTDPAQALRLRSYCWPENADRLARLDAVIALANACKPDLVKADAPDWVAAQLAQPQEHVTVRALFHSIVWQYIAPEGRERIEAAMLEAGAMATRERPLAWIMLETNRETFRHELRVRYWPGPDAWTLLGEAQAHGAWVEWRS
jgi:hypothetical protein